ncbi:HB2D protein, partial [Catharus fuscescens]|nr:HB2D protein [Catharus fuscescens]
PPDICRAHTEVFQYMVKRECHFSNGTEKVRYVERFIYNRMEYLSFDSDVGRYVGFTRHGEIQAWCWNREREWMEYKRAQVDWYCRHYYRQNATFLVEH